MPPTEGPTHPEDSGQPRPGLSSPRTGGKQRSEVRQRMQPQACRLAEGCPCPPAPRAPRARAVTLTPVGAAEGQRLGHGGEERCAVADLGQGRLGTLGPGLHPLPAPSARRLPSGPSAGCHSRRGRRGQGGVFSTGPPREQQGLLPKESRRGPSAEAPGPARPAPALSACPLPGPAQGEGRLVHPPT